MNGLTAALGIALVLVAIPFGFMLAPLVIGAILIWFAMRRLDDALAPLPAGEPA